MTDPQKNLLKLKSILDTEGFTTSWNDPFFAWVHNSSNNNEPSEPKNPQVFFIRNFPFPKVAPFDVVCMEISIAEIALHMSLDFYFSSVMEDLLEAYEFDEVFEKHNNEWLTAIDSLLADIIKKYSLERDVEYDVYIINSVWGSFKVHEVEYVMEIIRELAQVSRTL